MNLTAPTPPGMATGGPAPSGLVHLSRDTNRTTGHKISIYQQECTSQLTQATSCRQLLKLPEIEARTAQWQLVTSKYSQP